MSILKLLRLRVLKVSAKIWPFSLYTFLRSRYSLRKSLFTTPPTLKGRLSRVEQREMASIASAPGDVTEACEQRVPPLRNNPTLNAGAYDENNATVNSQGGVGNSNRSCNKRRRSAVMQVAGGKKSKKRQKITHGGTDVAGDAVLLRDVEALLRSCIQAGEGVSFEGNGASANLTQQQQQQQQQQHLERFSEIEVTVHAISSTGDGLALSSNLDRVYVVPFTLPGDVVLAKIVKNFERYTLTDFVRVIQPSPQRNDALVFCKYFGACSGCQFQMMPYDAQLDLKRTTIVKAFANFSGLAAELLPEVEPVMPSPLRQGYRTKLTPHFDRPRKIDPKDVDKVPDIGFQVKGRRFVLDIEDCPIGTSAVRSGLKERRSYVSDNISTFKRGATLLLRESTQRLPISPREGAFGTDLSAPLSYLERKECIFDTKEKCTEWIGDYCFESPAGSFFQNNNSILENFTDYVRRKLDAPFDFGRPSSRPRYLVDAYCGSGLFSVTCGRSFQKIIGVDISPESIVFARQNAERNSIGNAKFIAGQAEDIFAHIDFEPTQTSVIIDPPRKGCDESFLRQLLSLRPQRVVYISCNVHTLARDIGWLLSNCSDENTYSIDCLGGFDFFPQTHHVEGCAVLNRLEDKKSY